jgi:hypothetical protein
MRDLDELLLWIDHLRKELLEHLLFRVVILKQNIVRLVLFKRFCPVNVPVKLSLTGSVGVIVAINRVLPLGEANQLSPTPELVGSGCGLLMLHEHRLVVLVN